MVMVTIESRAWIVYELRLSPPLHSAASHLSQRLVVDGFISSARESLSESDAESETELGA